MVDKNLFARLRVNRWDIDDEKQQTAIYFFRGICYLYLDLYFTMLCQDQNRNYLLGLLVHICSYFKIVVVFVLEKKLPRTSLRATRNSKENKI